MPSDRTAYLAVAAGSAVGATARYLVSVVTLQGPNAYVPWATFGVNTSGSFLIGLLATLTLPEGRLRTSQTMRLFLLIGVLGGFTTFSVFSLEFVLLLTEQRIGQAIVLLLAGLLLWIPAAGLGHFLGLRLDAAGKTRSGGTPPGGIRTEDPPD